MHTAHFVGTKILLLQKRLLICQYWMNCRWLSCRISKKEQDMPQQNNKFYRFISDSFIRFIYILLGNSTPVSAKGKAAQRKKGASIKREDRMWSVWGCQEHNGQLSHRL